ncbi:MAG: hypothetical protein ACR2JE_16265, partial [Acidobacteriaceae bacterium]
MRSREHRCAGVGTTLVVFAGMVAGCSGPHPTALPLPVTEQSRFQTANMPSGSEGEQIRKGKLIFDETPKYASAYVGNRLACSDCHIQSGTAAHAG